MPPDECRSEGTPSPGEGPDAGAKPFAYFSAFGKVSRCKSETISSRYRRNGYVHLKEIGRLSGRLREQAHSHIGMGYIKGNLVGPKAAKFKPKPPKAST